MIKVLGVFIGIGDLEEANWHPRITSVKNTLNSWRQRHLSYHGRALVINALNLFFLGGFLWYQLSLKFGHFMCNGPGALLLVRLRGSIVYTCLGASPLDVLSRPSDFTLGSLPPFYRSFLSAWRAVNGGFSVSHGSFAIGCSSGLSISPVPTISTKSVYTFLLSENLSTPQCVVNFAPIFGLLYWSCTWRQLFLFDVDRPVIDVGKLHMEFFTLLIVLLPLVTLFSCHVFVILRLNLSIIFSSNALFLSLFFLGFNLLCFVGLCLLLLQLSVIFVSVLVLTRFLASRKCSSTS